MNILRLTWSQVIRDKVIEIKSEITNYLLNIFLLKDDSSIVQFAILTYNSI
jgi:hypothetical protein